MTLDKVQRDTIDISVANEKKKKKRRKTGQRFISRTGDKYETMVVASNSEDRWRDMCPVTRSFLRFYGNGA